LINLPVDRLYTKEHEWVKLDGTTATVGITDYAQSSLGDIVYVELPKPGTTVTQFKQMGVVESVKAVSDIYAPVSGEVTEINGDVENDPAKVNNDPYNDGWLVKIQVAGPQAVMGLLKPADYQAIVDAAAQ
jgi:glycine cleavage system H protein